MPVARVNGVGDPRLAPYRDVPEPELVRAAGFTRVALTPRQPSETLERYAAGPRSARLALMVGTEGAGLTPAAEAAADVRVSIPMSGDVDSLNLGVALGIALFMLGPRRVFP
jgi:tRNA G18 (ribose-2'-O)-methylase SpoU